MKDLATVPSPLARWERAFILSICGFIFASRMLFATRMLYHWDAVQFVLGMHEYNVTKHQPHPPGYFLYVMLGRVVHAFLPDPNYALVFLGILASAAAVPLLYRLARGIFGQSAACATVIFFATSPVVWFFGEVALSDIVEGCAVTAVGLLCWRARGGDRAALFLSAVALGLAGGVRQQCLPMLFPLWLYCAWPHGWRRCLGAMALGALAIAAWATPMVLLSGGLTAYREEAAYVWRSTHGSAAMRRLISPGQSAAMIFAFCFLALAAALIPMALAVYARLRGTKNAPAASNAMPFLALWIGVPLVFYTAAIVVRAGILMTFYPALFVLAGGAVAALLGARPTRQLAVLLFILGAFNSSLFLFTNGNFSAGELRRHDRELRAMVEGVRRAFPPARTVIATQGQHFYKGFRIASYYLPEYRVIETDWPERPPWVLGYQGNVRFSVRPPLPPQTRWIILFDHPEWLPPRLKALYPRAVREVRKLPGGVSLTVYRVGQKKERPAKPDAP